MIAGVMSVLLFVLVGLLLGAAVGGPLGLLVAAILLVLGASFGYGLLRSRAYDLRTARGVLLFVVDHTWSLLNTLAASVFLLVNLAKRNRLDVESSRGTNEIVFTRGVVPGFATTIGNVIAGLKPGRVSLRHHEEIHVLQARLFGPLYLPLVGVGYAVAAVLPYWLLYHDRATRPIRSFRDYFMSGVYPHVWNEEWAYSVGGVRP